MNSYVTGSIIRRLREEKEMTQSDLARILSVSDKAVSKWETGKGYPDITLIRPLAQALGISADELLSGRDISNTNRSFHMLRSGIHVCPVCGNIIIGTGEAMISCCGITLPSLEAEEPDDRHRLKVSRIDGEYYAVMEHDMSKTHYISFMAALTDTGTDLIKLYPEGPCEARFPIGRTRYICYYCNHHGLFRIRV